MDNLTHSLVGAAISKAGAERATPLATTTLVIAANAPDVDILSFVRGEYFALAFRRGITHGWPALLVLPFVVTAGIVAWDRLVRRGRDASATPVDARATLLLAAAGLLTHPTLDWLNTYGMRWGLPFDGTWTYGDALFIIDPWVWLALGGSVLLASDPGPRGRAGWAVLAVLSTLVVVLGMGGAPALVWTALLALVVALRWRLGPGRGGSRTAVARAALSACALYVTLMIGADAGARRDVLRAADAAGLEAREVMVAPLRGTPLSTDVEILTDLALVPGSHGWLRKPRVRLRPEDEVPLLSTPGIDDGLADRVVEVARGRPQVRNYLVWARFPYVRVTPSGDGWDVLHADARYDSQPEAAGLAGVRVHVTEDEVR